MCAAIASTGDGKGLMACFGLAGVIGRCSLSCERFIGRWGGDVYVAAAGLLEWSRGRWWWV